LLLVTNVLNLHDPRAGFAGKCGRDRGRDAWSENSSRGFDGVLSDEVRTAAVISRCQQASIPSWTVHEFIMLSKW